MIRAREAHATLIEGRENSTGGLMKIGEQLRRIEALTAQMCTRVVVVYVDGGDRCAGH